MKMFDDDDVVLWSVSVCVMFVCDDGDDGD